MASIFNTFKNQIYLNLNEDVAALNQNGSLIIGTKTGVNLAFDADEIMARNNSVASTLYLNNQGGLVQIGNGGLSVPYLRTSPAVGENATDKRLAGARLTFNATPNADGAGTYSNHSGWVGSSANGQYYGLYSVTQEKYLVAMNTNTGDVTLNGNAATATALTSSAGSSTLPVYFSAGKPVAISQLAIEKTDTTSAYVRVKNSVGNILLYAYTDGTRGIYDSTKTAWMIKTTSGNSTYIPDWASIGNTYTNPINMDSSGRPKAITFTASRAIVSNANGGLASADLSVTNPDSSGGTSNLVFVSSLTQNAQGKITITRNPVRVASDSQSGILSTGTQTIAGAKTFTNAMTIQGNLTLNSSSDDELKIYQGTGSKYISLIYDEIRAMDGSNHSALYLNYYGGSVMLASPNALTTIRGSLQVNKKLILTATSYGDANLNSLDGEEGQIYFKKI